MTTFKVGDVVADKSDIHKPMSVLGFSEYFAAPIPNLSTEAGDWVWVICKYKLKDGKYEHTVFHKDQLEISDNTIDGGGA